MRRIPEWARWPDGRCIPAWRTTEAVPVPLPGEIRKGHVNLLTRAEWLADKHKQNNTIENDMEESLS